MGKKVNRRKIPKMGRRVSTIEDQLLLWIHIFINPICPGPQSPSIGLNCFKLWIEIIAFFIVIFPASTNQISYTFREAPFVFMKNKTRKRSLPFN
jgi:hypothetical protein